MKVLDLKNPFNAPVFYKEETESTMIDMSSVTAPAHGTVITAGYQNKGRGRGKNRIWSSNKNRNLLFTISLNPSNICHPLVLVPLICGLALARYMQSELNLISELKWPNDILIKKRKISGILCEYKNGNILAGIGINCLEDHFDIDLRNKTTSLKLENIENPLPEQILEGYLPYLKQTLEQKLWKEDTLKILYGYNQIIEVLEGSTEHQTRKSIKITGLSEEGFLQVKEIETGVEKTLCAGEIRFSDFA